HPARFLQGGGPLPDRRGPRPPGPARRDRRARSPGAPHGGVADAVLRLAARRGRASSEPPRHPSAGRAPPRLEVDRRCAGVRSPLREPRQRLGRRAARALLCPRRRATLADLVQELSGLIAQTRFPLDLEGNMQRLESDRSAVQIMTIHKAKGLEAPLVFVAGGMWLPRSDDVRVFHEGGRRLAWVGTPSPEVKATIEREEGEEEER